MPRPVSKEEQVVAGVVRLIERERQRELEGRALTVFCPNERVVVEAPNHPGFEGVVQKITRKTLTVLGDDGQLYRVTPSLCRHHGRSRSG